MSQTRQAPAQRPSPTSWQDPQIPLYSSMGENGHQSQFLASSLLTVKVMTQGTSLIPWLWSLNPALTSYVLFSSCMPLIYGRICFDRSCCAFLAPELQSISGPCVQTKGLVVALALLCLSADPIFPFSERQSQVPQLPQLRNRGTITATSTPTHAGISPWQQGFQSLFPAALLLSAVQHWGVNSHVEKGTCVK